MKLHYHKPKDKISKLNEYFDLLNDLFHCKKGDTEEELLYRIDNHQAQYTADKHYIFQQLLGYELIEETSDFIPRYLLSLPYQTFIEHLYQYAQPVNALIIAGYIASLNQSIESLQAAYDATSPRLTHRRLMTLSKQIDMIAQASSHNRLGVIGEVRKLTANEDKLSYKERLIESNRLWDEYLEPLRKMIAPSGSFGLLMDRLKQTLESGDIKFNATIELRQLFSINRAKRMQLNEQARHDLNEAQAELAPLREKLTQESLLLEATAVIFDRLEQGELNELPYLALGRQLWHERDIRLFAMRDYLSNLWQIKTDPEGFSYDETENTEHSSLDTQALMAFLDDVPPDTDILTALLTQYKNIHANDLFRAMSILTMHQQDIPLIIKDEPTDYLIQHQLWRGLSYIKETTS